MQNLYDFVFLFIQWKSMGSKTTALDPTNFHCIDKKHLFFSFKKKKIFFSVPQKNEGLKTMIAFNLWLQQPFNCSHSSVYYYYNLPLEQKLCNFFFNGEQSKHTESLTQLFCED